MSRKSIRNRMLGFCWAMTTTSIITVFSIIEAVCGGRERNSFNRFKVESSLDNTHSREKTLNTEQKISANIEFTMNGIHCSHEKWVQH